MDRLGYTKPYDDDQTHWYTSVIGMVNWFSQLFSDVGPYIAPTYRHDRIYRSVQMKLYTLNKRQFVLVFVTFFICFSLSVLIGLAGPEIVTDFEIDSAHMSPPPDNGSMSTGPFILNSPPLSTFNQQLWLMCRFKMKPEKKRNSRYTVPFELDIGIQGNKDAVGHLITPDSHNHSKSRELECTKTYCNELIILHLGFLNYDNYVITVMVHGLDDVAAVTFTFKMYNTSFTQLEIWFRFVFLVFTFIGSCMFAHTMRRFAMRDWSIEQKWISILLPLLLLYNNPVFPLTFLVNSWVPAMLDALFQATFLSMLLLFWLCVYHGIRQSQRSFSKFYLPKIIIVFLVWLSAFVLAAWQEYRELQDPTYSYKHDVQNYIGLKIFFFLVGGVYLLYLLFLIIRAYSELRTLPYFDLRLKFLTGLMLVVLTISIAIIVMRFGTSMLAENFVSDLATHYKNSAEFLSFYGLLNFYMYTMAFVYSPSKNAQNETHFRDNPTFSMLNESDDEVIYGTDDDNVNNGTMPLNPSRYHDSESD